MELLQSEKKQMLIQQENEKMKERDDQYTEQLKDWRVQISQRKKVNITIWSNSFVIILYRNWRQNSLHKGRTYKNTLSLK